MSESRRLGRMVTACVALVAGLLWRVGLPAQPRTAPSLDDVLRRMGVYVAGYGEQASLIVAVERYTQRLSGTGFSISPRTLVAEFAVVKAPADEGWTGYRDVVEVDGRRIPDRADRLLTLFTGSPQPAEMLRRIDSENARFNVGPISRNINVPTTALYFLHPVRQHRFVFKKTREKDLDGIAIEKREVRRMETVEPPPSPEPLTPGGRGTSTPPAPPPPPPPPSTQQAVVTTKSDVVRLESLAEIEVTYRRHEDLGLWLPWKMSELYEGPLRGAIGRAESVATYSDFKRFTTDVRMRDPK